MKKLYLLFFCICSVATLAAQPPILAEKFLGEEYVSLNFILVRNNEVLDGGNVSITAIDSLDQKVVIEVSYDPGNLLIKKSKYDALQKMSNYKLCFEYQKELTYDTPVSYEIKFDKELFHVSYVIIDINDYCVEKHRKKWVFRPWRGGIKFSYQLLTNGISTFGFVKADTTLE